MLKIEVQRTTNMELNNKIIMPLVRKTIKLRKINVVISMFHSP